MNTTTTEQSQPLFPSSAELPSLFLEVAEILSYPEDPALSATSYLDDAERTMVKHNYYTHSNALTMLPLLQRLTELYVLQLENKDYTPITLSIQAFNNCAKSSRQKIRYAFRYISEKVNIKHRGIFKCILDNLDLRKFTDTTGRQCLSVRLNVFAPVNHLPAEDAIERTANSIAEKAVLKWLNHIATDYLVATDELRLRFASAAQAQRKLISVLDKLGVAYTLQGVVLHVIKPEIPFSEKDLAEALSAETLDNVLLTTTTFLE